MASISRRGPFQFQAIVRRKGYPTQTKTFETRNEAEAWSRSIESKIDVNQFRDRRELETLTLGNLLQRYQKEVTPPKTRCRTRRQPNQAVAQASAGTATAVDFACQ